VSDTTILSRVHASSLPRPRGRFYRVSPPWSPKLSASHGRPPEIYRRRCDALPRSVSSFRPS
jgi:hypothetical protein